MLDLGGANRTVRLASDLIIAHEIQVYLRPARLGSEPELEPLNLA